MFQLVTKLKMVKERLKVLNLVEFGDLKGGRDRAWYALRQSQEELDGDKFNLEKMVKEKQLLGEYQAVENSLLSQLKQTSKLQWAKDGDHNSGVSIMLFKK